MRHDTIERNLNLMIVLIIVAISFGTLVELVPLAFSKKTTTPIEGLEPYSALELEGRDIYIREGCHTCHSQMIRPFRSETERYGPFTTAGETVIVNEAGEVIRKMGGIASGLAVATALMIVFRQRYPRWWFDFVRELLRFEGRVLA